MKRLFSLLLLLTATLGAFSMVIESGTSIVIDQSVNEDLYLAGGTITINAPVFGDLIVTGGTIYVNDSISHDILVAGGNVTINGYVGGKVICTGGIVRITKDIRSDLVVAGARVVLEKGSTIYGSLMAIGANLTLNGTVNGDIKARAGQIILSGTAGRNLDCRGDKIEIDGTIAGTAILAASNYLMIGNKAVFHQEVRYWTPDKAPDFGHSLQKGTAIADKNLAIKGTPWYFFGAATFWGVCWYLAMGLVTIILLQYLLAPLLRRAGDTVYSSMIRAFGTGFLFLAGTPVLIVLAFLTLVAAPVGLFLLFGYITLWLISTSIVSVVSANWLSNGSRNNTRFWPLVWKAFGLSLLLRIILYTPFLGWFLFLVLLSIACGAVLLNIKWKRQTPSLQPTT